MVYIWPVFDLYPDVFFVLVNDNPDHLVGVFLFQKYFGRVSAMFRECFYICITKPDTYAKRNRNITNWKVASG